MTPEAAARQKIDELLVAAAWTIPDYKQLKHEDLEAALEQFRQIESDLKS